MISNRQLQLFNLSWILSILCLIHCMTLPLISIFLPLIKVSHELNEVISKVFLGLVIILSFNLVIRNRILWKSHKGWITLLTLGILGMFLSHPLAHFLGVEDHAITTILITEVPFSIALVTGQLVLLRAARNCYCCGNS
ncbi:MAG TPA: hypothetical protein DEO99_04380 [Bacteroidetes bacterium]|nr:hypothetical protein [Bacteroidota bacterium]